MKALTLRITGRVQGVGFRAFTRDTAEGLGLSGWVQNEPDGAVTAHLQGDAAALAEMVKHLHDGPRFARVDRVETAATDPVPGRDGVEIRR